MEVQLGETTLELPDGATPEQIKKAVAGFRSTPEFGKIIDKSTGAPAGLRAIVGGAPIDDRLANVRETYPDAQPYDGDNFVFTNPDTGLPTLYNPTGLDFGDLASLGREATMTAGGAVGAAIGGGSTFGLGTVTGAGLGAAAGGQAFDIVAEFLAGGINTQTGMERASTAAIDFGATAVGQRLGEVAPLAVKKAIGGIKPLAQRLVGAFRNLKIDPPGGAATGSRSLATVESMLESNPASGDIMQKQAEKVLEQTAKAAKEVAGKFGKARSTEGAGTTVKQAATQAIARFDAKRAVAYDKAFDMIGKDRPVAVAAVTALREDMESELARAPHSLARSLQSAIAQARKLELDAADGGIPFGALREIRTALGRELDAPVLIGSTSTKNAALKRLYGAQTEDMSAAAQSASAKAGKLLNDADRLNRLWMNDQGKLMKKLAGYDADDKAFRFLMTSAKDGGRLLGKMRGQFLPEEWDDVAASVLAKMGRANPGAQDATQEAFSAATFMTNWSKIAPEAKKALFSGKRYAGLQKELDNLVEVVGSLKGIQKVANTSNTGRTMIAYTMVQTLIGGMVGTAAGGDAQSGLAGATAAILGPRAVAKLITSPSFIKWLTTPVTSANAVGPHIGRLLAIAKANPDIKEEVHQYVKALRGTQ